METNKEKKNLKVASYKLSESLPGSVAEKNREFRQVRQAVNKVCRRKWQQRVTKFCKKQEHLMKKYRGTQCDAGDIIDGVRVGDDVLEDKKKTQLVTRGVFVEEEIEHIGELAPNFATYPKVTREDMLLNTGKWATSYRWGEMSARIEKAEMEDDQQLAKDLGHVWDEETYREAVSYTHLTLPTKA